MDKKRGKRVKKSGAITNAEAKDNMSAVSKLLVKTKDAHEKSHEGKRKVIVRIDRKTVIEKWV